jgi:hypothetical protein
MKSWNAGDKVNASDLNNNFDETLKGIHTLVAGQALSAYEAVGMYGEIEETVSDKHEITSGACGDSDNPNTNNQVVAYRRVSTTAYIYAFISFTDLANTLPSGATALAIRLYGYQTGGTSGCTAAVKPNTSSFDKTTVTWNTKPSVGSSIGTITSGLTSEWHDTGWMTITSAQWADICDHGITLEANNANYANAIVWDDEDDTNPMYLLIKYKIANGKVFKIKATTQEYIDSFIGFTTEAKSKDQDIKIQSEHIITNESWDLTKGVIYYLSDTDGEISTSPGSNTKKVGIAVDTTKLFILN